MYPIQKSRLEDPQRLSGRIIEGPMHFILRMHRMHLLLHQQRSTYQGLLNNLQRSLQFGIPQGRSQLIVEVQKLPLLPFETNIKRVQHERYGDELKSIDLHELAVFHYVFEEMFFVRKLVMVFQMVE
jgi:hypothetical protein